MLILDKQKAVEHMVALTRVVVLTDSAADAEPEPHLSPRRRRGRTQPRVATFERSAAHIEPLPEPERKRRATPSRGIAPA